MRIETDDNVIIQRLKRKGLLDLLENFPTPNLPDVAPTLIYRDGKDTYIRFIGRDKPRDTGYIWLRINRHSVDDILLVTEFMAELLSQHEIVSPVLETRN